MKALCTLVLLFACVHAFHVTPLTSQNNVKAKEAINKLHTNFHRTAVRQSEACIEAINQLAELQNCSFPEFDDDVETEVESFCTATDSCSPTTITANLQSVLDNCAVEYIEEYWDDIELLIEMVNLICSQDDEGNYCAAVVYNISTFDWDNYLSEENLETFCSPCVYEFWGMAVSYATGEELNDYYGFLAVCMQDGDTWCILELQDISDAIISEDWVTVSELSCSSTCIPRYIALSEEFADDFAPAMQVMCLKNNDGEFCFPKVIESVEENDLVNICTDFTSECQTAIENVIEDTGCCFQAIFNMLADETTQKEFQDLLDYLEIDIPDECPVATEIDFTLLLENIDPDYVAENWESYAEYLASDFSLNTGVPEDNVEVSLDETSKRQSGTTVYFTASSGSDDSNTNTVASLNSMVSSGSFALYGTASNTPYEGLIDPLFSISVSSSSSAELLSTGSTSGSNTQESGNSAGSLSAFLLTCLLLSIISSLFA